MEAPHPYVVHRAFCRQGYPCQVGETIHLGARQAAWYQLDGRIGLATSDATADPQPKPTRKQAPRPPRRTPVPSESVSLSE